MSWKSGDNNPFLYVASSVGPTYLTPSFLPDFNPFDLDDPRVTVLFCEPSSPDWVQVTSLILICSTATPNSLGSSSQFNLIETSPLPSIFLPSLENLPSPEIIVKEVFVSLPSLSLRDIFFPLDDTCILPPLWDEVPLPLTSTVRVVSPFSLVDLQVLPASLISFIAVPSSSGSSL